MFKTYVFAKEDYRLKGDKDTYGKINEKRVAMQNQEIISNLWTYFITSVTPEILIQSCYCIFRYSKRSIVTTF